MLSAYPNIPEGSPPVAPVWIDLRDPTEAEAAEAQAAFGAPIPSFHDLSEIETSSRLRVAGQRIFLSTPLVYGSETPEPHLTPVGFLLSPTLLVTVHFTTLKAFDQVVSDCGSEADLSAEHVFVRLLEEIVDRQADHLEHVGAKLDQISRETFSRAAGKAGAGQLDNNALRLTLAALGAAGDRLSMTRDALLGVARIAPFVMERGHACVCDTDNQTRLKAVRMDVASLADYETHLSDKTQFLLDAVLGLINVAQNDIFKVLTIVSVVGIPPTFIASMYGMNFHRMPELEWAWGYPYALALIVVSTLLPLAWFKWRKWM